MKENKKFKIDIYGLKNAIHEYDFDFDNEFFEDHENGLIEAGHGTCHILLNKKDTMIELSFSIKGSIELTCDRSLDKFDHLINLSEKLIVKYGEAFDNSNDEFWVIPSNEQSLYLGSTLFEFLTLAVPMKKLHPRFTDEDNDSELSFVYSSTDADSDPQSEENNESDPRWDALKNIKNLN